jgi:hypothetical protein
MIVVDEEKKEVVVGGPDVDVNPQISDVLHVSLTSTCCQSRMVTEACLAGIGFPDTYPQNFHYFFNGKVTG